MHSSSHALAPFLPPGTFTDPARSTETETRHNHPRLTRSQGNHVFGERSTRTQSQSQPRTRHASRGTPNPDSNHKTKTKADPKIKPKTKHSPSPFQRTLYLSNLPHTIKPSHFDYILSHPHIARGKPKRAGMKKDPGVSMIQIYTLPYEPPKPTFNPLTKLFKRALCLSAAWTNDEGVPQVVERDHEKVEQELVSAPASPVAPAATASDETPLGSASGRLASDVAADADTSAPSSNLSGNGRGVPRSAPSDNPESTPRSLARGAREGTRTPATTLGQPTTVEAREVELDLDAVPRANAAGHSSISRASRASRNSNATSSSEERVKAHVNDGKGERGDTIAWIHFRTEDHLYKAKHLLTTVSIDGQKIKVRCDRFNHGIIRGGCRSFCDRVRARSDVFLRPRRGQRVRKESESRGVKADEGIRPLAFVGVGVNL